MQTVQFEGKPYKISFDSMSAELKQKLPGEKLTRYLQLLEIVQLKPKSIYKEVKAFASEHTDVPEVINLLTFAHIQNRRVLEAEKLIKKTFEDHPDYLFARINYADQCVRKKDLKIIPTLFPTFDLKELCPEKKIFHTSEFRGFLIMLAYYQLALKDREKALHYFEAAKKIEPNHPSVLYLQKKLFKKPFFARLFRKK